MEAKEAQERTEKRWLAIIADPTYDVLVCGWCVFASDMAAGKVPWCHKCPVVRVFGDSCCNIPEYLNWGLGSENAEEARKVYELLIAHRDQLIAAAKEIEGEHSGRVE